MKHPGLINKVHQTKNEVFNWSDDNFAKAIRQPKSVAIGKEITK